MMDLGKCLGYCQVYGIVEMTLISGRLRTSKLAKQERWHVALLAIAPVFGYPANKRCTTFTSKKLCGQVVPVAYI